MKTTRLLSILFASATLLVNTRCGEEDGITYSMTDKSERISSYGTQKAGTGAPLIVNGTDMDKVDRIAVGNLVVPKRTFTNVSESSLTFIVPQTATIGKDQPILFVYPGSERAFSSIEVIPFQVVTDFAPRSVVEGDTVNVTGRNFQVVTAVKLGSVSVPFVAKSQTVLRFKVPAGITDGPITMISEAGQSNTALTLVSCDANPSSSDCPDGLNLNSGFELGTGDSFDNWNKFNGGTKLLATTNVYGNEVYRGKRALKVIRDGTLTPATDQWRIQLASDFVATDNGASYTVYAWVRATIAGAQFRFSNQDAAQYGPNTDVPVTWTRVSWTFASNATQKRIVLDLNGGPSTTFFIDDIKLIKNP